ncbi:MA3 domain containing protein [Gracilaria domingensis]|nr:MA3 domain containing protein [Gracilaria domingensis]
MRSPKSPSAARGRQFDRHVSGTGTRGLPKKGGAGGKGVWGAAMDQEGVAYLDKKDPNYDSDQEQQLPPQLQLGANAPPPPQQPDAPPAAAQSADAGAAAADKGAEDAAKQ